MRVPLKRVAALVGGSTPSPDSENWDGSVNWLTPTDIAKSRNGFIGEGARTLTKTGLANCGAKLAPAGSVVVTTRAPIGNLAITKLPSATNQGCRTIVPGPSLDPRFLWYQLTAHVEELRHWGSGSTFSELSTKSLGALELPIVARATQGAIADFLDRECDRIRALDESLKSLNEAGIELALGRLAESVDDLPVGRVGYMFEVQLGKMLDEKRHRDGELRPYLRNANVQWDNFDLNELKEMTFLPNELKRFSARAGDLLVCEGGDPGRCAIWNGPEGICFQKALLRVRSLADASVRYLFWVLRLYHRRGDFRADGTGSTILHLPAERLRALSIPLPDVVTQVALARQADDIAGNASEFDREVSVLRDLLAEYRDALITEAVTGKLDVSRLSDALMEESLAAVREGEKPEVLSR
jgi:type I restriction enzyme, S subunit